MNQKTNAKIIKVAILSIPVFVIGVNDFLLYFPISILLSTLMSTFAESVTWFGPISFMLFPLKIAISVATVYYAMKKWNQYFPPVK